MTDTLAPPKETIAADEPQLIAEFIAFLREASIKRHRTGPILRFNQGRATGCVEAEFTVADDLPPEHRVGLFARPRTYRAWIRFANASSHSDKQKDIRGMSIKVFDVPGENLTPGSTTHDFVLNSHSIMVAPDTRAFLELLKSMEEGGLQRALYFVTHPRSARIGFAARDNPASHLDISYWSTTPYLFGADRAVKYIARPAAPGAASPPDPLTDDYLLRALRTRLERAEASFDFMVQFQSDSRSTPIEDASVEWRERDSPYRRVARVRIPPQRIDDPARTSTCEEISFNPWNAPVDHRPLGNMNRARREIYWAMDELRRQRRSR
jgi:hypothetical protein